MCNGHADTCDIQDSQDPSVLLCRCQHNTCGAKCDTCCPGFEQKKWQQSKVNHPFVCERKFFIFLLTHLSLTDFQPVIVFNTATNVPTMTRWTARDYL